MRADLSASTPIFDAPEPPEQFPQFEGYDVIDRVGRGAMGVVFEAIQKSTGRRVALKLMSGPDHGGAGRRFAREVELTARLKHPCIVSIYDSGVHQGAFYYVMEFVDGVALDVALAPGERPVADVLEVMAQVCEAVDYAHQRGVLHRDLKPANIILDERGTPRVLDFGLARAIDPGSAVIGADAFASVSMPGQMVGTLAYMAPEQALGRSAQVGVRSDVYALGAIVYHLLTGVLATDVEGPLHQVVKRIAQAEPARPSSLRKGVSRDLDAVVLKALEKSAEKRYATAGELGAELRRAAIGQPVTARRVGIVTRAARWAGRNPAISIPLGVCLVAGVLLLGQSVRVARMDAERVASERQLELLNQRISRRTDRANLEEGSAEDIGRLISDGEVVLELSDRAPRAGAELLQKIGRKLIDFQRPEQARCLFDRALSLRVREFGADSKEADESRFWQATSLFWLNRVSESEALYEHSLSRRVVLFGERSPEVAVCRQYLGNVLARLGRYAEAEGLLCSAVSGWARLKGSGSAPARESMMSLAACMLDAGKFPEAEAMYGYTLSAFDMSAEPVPRLHRAYVLHGMGVAALRSGRLEEARSALVEALRIKSSLYPADNAVVATTLQALADVDLEKGSAREALAYLERAMAAYQRVNRAHTELPRVMSSRAVALLQLGRIVEARESAEGTEAVWTEGSGADSRKMPVSVRASVGLVLRATGCPERGIPMQMGAYEEARGALGEGHPTTQTVLERLLEGEKLSRGTR